MGAEGGERKKVRVMAVGLTEETARRMADALVRDMGEAGSLERVEVVASWPGNPEGVVVRPELLATDPEAVDR